MGLNAESRSMSKAEAVMQMTRLVNRHLGTQLRPEDIESLFDKHWRALSLYAHAIHTRDALGDDRPLPDYGPVPDRVFGGFFG